MPLREGAREGGKQLLRGEGGTGAIAHARDLRRRGQVEGIQRIITSIRTPCQTT